MAQAACRDYPTLGLQAPGEASMPLMSWDAFFERHHRPFMIHAQEGIETPRVQLGTLQRFIGSMSLKGNFALLPGDKFLRAVFELKEDALRVAQTLGASPVGRGDEWAKQWLLSADWATAEAAPMGTSWSRRSPGHHGRPKQRSRQRWRQLTVAEWIIGSGLPSVRGSR